MSYNNNLYKDRNYLLDNANILNTDSSYYESLSNDNFSYFNSDNVCYKSIIPDVSLNDFLNNNFYITTINSTDEVEAGDINLCQKFALDINKKYFLISDICNNNQSSNNFTYNCYVPKKGDNCDISSNGVFNLTNLFQPFTQTLTDLLGDNLNPLKLNSINPIQEVTDITSANLTIPLNLNSNKCFKYVLNNGENYFAKRGYFYLHKMELIYPNKPLNLNIKHDYDYYNNAYKKYFNSSYYKPLFSDIQQKMINYFCSSDSLSNTNSLNFDGSLENLEVYYNKLFNYLNDISVDISNISIGVNYETLYLQNMQDIINKEKKNLKNLLDSDGANNGKLNDTKFINYLRIAEINVLIIVIIIFIFIIIKI